MNKLAKYCVLIAVLLLAAVCFAGVAAADDAAYTECNGKMCVDSCLFIKCDLSTPEGNTIAGEVTVLTDHSDISPGLLLIETPAGMTVSEAVTYFEKLPGIEFAEPDYVYQAPANTAVPADNLVLMSSSSDDTYPNDPRFSEQWALKIMNVPAAWDVTTGSDEVVVAVIDSGVNYNHLDIIDNMWRNPREIPDNGIDDDGNGYVDDYYGYNFGDNNSDPVDNSGHGTHVAGIIGAVGNNGIGICGVSPEVSIMDLRVTKADGSQDINGTVQAIKYATKMGAKIINISLGGYSESTACAKAFEDAAEKGILVVAGGGNNAEDTDVLKFYPACNEVENILSVSALDSTGSLAVYSNYGSFADDVAAPGGGKPSDLLSLSHTDNDGYVLMSGTSMATPMVSGLAALLLAENPALNAVDLKCIIMATVTQDAALKGKVVTGGKVNAGEAVKNAVHNKYHMVTFNSLVKKNGTETMTEIGSQVVEDGHCITVPETPSKYFMKFDGWYTDKECNTPWNFSAAVTKDVKLYAKWVEDTSLNIDTSWYTPEQTEYHISTAAQLLGLSKIIYDAPFDTDDPASYAFYGKTVVLDNDISLAGIDWVPVGVAKNNAFAGVFNGNGHTISGLSVNLPKENYVGLFGYNAGRVTDLTLEASGITGHNYVGTLCGEGNRMDKVHVTVTTVTGHNSVGGLMGYRPATADIADDRDITVTVGAVYADAIEHDERIELPARGAGGAIGDGVANNITVHAGNIVSTDMSMGGKNVGGAFGYARTGFHDISVTVSSITGLRYVGGVCGYASEGFRNVSAEVSSITGEQYVGGVCGTAMNGFRNVSIDVSSVSGLYGIGGIAGEVTGDVSNCSAVIGNITTYEGGAAFGYYHQVVVSQTAEQAGNTIKDVFVSANGNAAGSIEYLLTSTGGAGESCKLTIENVLVTGSLSDSNVCGGIFGCILNDGSVPFTVSVRNCVCLLQSVSTGNINCSGRIYGTVIGDADVSTGSSYGWEGTVNSQGALFDSSDGKNGRDVLTSSVWDKQSFFEELGWDFTGIWQMNTGNDNFKLPVLQNTRSTGTLDASYLLDHTVHFNANGGTGTMADQEFTDSSPERLTLNTFTHDDGYSFVGWAESSSGTILYLDKDLYPARKSTTLYAVWEFSKNVENKDGAEVEIKDTTDFGSIDSVTFVEAPGDSVVLEYTKNSSVSTSGLEGTPIGSQFEINVYQNEKKITSRLKTEVSFSVNKSELGDDQVPDVKLAHWTSENRWEYLATTPETDGENYQFTAEVTGFSPFAIVIKADEPVKSSSSSVTAFFGEKDGSDFTFKRAVVITKATLPGASSATVVNTSGSGWYTCNLSTDGITGNGVLYFQVPLDVIDIKGYTVNDVSMLGCRTTYLSSDDQYAYYSAIITKDGALTIDFEKDAAQKAVETTPVTETKTVETPVTTTPVTTETTPVTETAAKTPFPVLGILAGLGIAGLVALRRK